MRPEGRRGAVPVATAATAPTAMQRGQSLRQRRTGLARSEACGYRTRCGSGGDLPEGRVVMNSLTRTAGHLLETPVQVPVEALEDREYVQAKGVVNDPTMRSITVWVV